MAGKKKTKKRGKAARKRGRSLPLDAMSAAQLRAHGRRALDAGRHAEAIEAFRLLRRHDPGPEADELFRAAATEHLGRLTAWGRQEDARRLAATIEAELPGALPVPVRVATALLDGRLDTAVELVADHAAELGDTERERIEEWLAIALLLDPGEAASTRLPANTPLRAHLDAARAALDAMGRDPAAAAAALKRIPYRSPLRNFRLLCAGILAEAEAAGAGRGLFDRLPGHSPCRAILPSIEWARTEPAELLRRLCATAEADLVEGGPVTAALGLPPRVVRCLRDLGEAGDRTIRLARVLVRYRDLLPRAVGGDLLVRLLYNESSPDRAAVLLGEFFGGDEGEREFARLNALILEDFEDGELLAKMAWREYLECCGPELDDLGHALVLRRLATVCGRMPFGVHERLRYLEQSLEYDPSDRDTWIAAHGLALKEHGRNYAYRLANRAAAALPDDVTVLRLQMDAAVDRGAFKKAADIAARILAVDPVNVAAKDGFVRARLAHGCKQARAGRISLALRTLAMDPPEGVSSRYQGLPWIAYGLACLRQGDDEEGWAAVEAGLDRIPNRAGGLFLAVVYADLLDVPERWRRRLQERWDAAVHPPPPVEDIVEILAWMRDCADDREEEGMLGRADMLDPLLPAVVEHPWDAEEGRQLCRRLLELNCWPAVLLYRLAGRLQDAHPDASIFRFFFCWAAVEVEERRLTGEEETHLKSLAVRLLQSGDKGEEVTALFIEVLHLVEQRQYEFERKPGPPLRQPALPGFAAGADHGDPEEE